MISNIMFILWVLSAQNILQFTYDHLEGCGATTPPKMSGSRKKVWVESILMKLCEYTPSLPAPFRCSTLGYAPGLTRKHLTRLGRLARDKHSSLLQKSVNFGRKKFFVHAIGANVKKHFTNGPKKL